MFLTENSANSQFPLCTQLTSLMKCCRYYTMGWFYSHMLSFAISSYVHKMQNTLKYCLKWNKLPQNTCMLMIKNFTRRLSISMLELTRYFLKDDPFAWKGGWKWALQAESLHMPNSTDQDCNLSDNSSPKIKGLDWIISCSLILKINFHSLLCHQIFHCSYF